jgi:hypothetical protein
MHLDRRAVIGALPLESRLQRYTLFQYTGGPGNILVSSKDKLIESMINDVVRVGSQYLSIHRSRSYHRNELRSVPWSYSSPNSAATIKPPVFFKPSQPVGVIGPGLFDRKRHLSTKTCSPQSSSVQGANLSTERFSLQNSFLLGEFLFGGSLSSALFSTEPFSSQNPLLPSDHDHY